jgi:predicted outer membrane protein
VLPGVILGLDPRPRARGLRAAIAGRDWKARGQKELIPTQEKTMNFNVQRMATIGTLCAGACIAQGAAIAQTQAASTTVANSLSSVDKDFVQAASMSSSTEIDVSRLATSNSSDQDVKSFAHHMMLDHTKLTLQLKMAAPHGVEVPKDNSDTVLLDSLKPLKSADFDKAYISKVGLEGRKQAIAAFEKEAADGQNADLKKAAQKALPTIKEHYQMAQQVAAKKGVSQ